MDRLRTAATAWCGTGPTRPAAAVLHAARGRGHATRVLCLASRLPFLLPPAELVQWRVNIHTTITIPPRRMPMLTRPSCLPHALAIILGLALHAARPAPAVADDQPGPAGSLPPPAAKAVDYERDVAPILAKSWPFRYVPLTTLEKIRQAWASDRGGDDGGAGA